MPPGDSSLIPDPPPPRPAARDEAIAAAMRRFDGVEDHAPARAERPRSTGGWIRKPQFATAMSLGLIAIIGGPLTWLAVRNGALEPPSEPATPPAASSPAATPSAAPEAAPLARATPSQGAQAPDLVAAPSLPEAKKDVAPVVAAPVELRTTDSAQELAAAPPPPPPPPPPPAPSPVAQKAAEGMVANDLVVTGSRIARPAAPAAERDETDALAEMGGYEPEPYRFNGNPSYAQFMTRLQIAVRAGDRDAVIGLIKFPLRVNENGRHRMYRNARAVRENYDRIFTPKVTQAILGQRTDAFFGSSAGVMVGNGEIWFEQSCPNRACSPPGPVRIISVNR